MGRRLPDCVLTVTLDRSEYEAIAAMAKSERLTIAAFVRRCINRFFIERDADVILLEVRQPGRWKKGERRT